MESLAPGSSPILSPGSSPILDEAIHNFITGKLHAAALIALMAVAIILACIMVLGSVRKRTNNGSFKYILRFTVMITPMLISYAVGQMTYYYDPKYLQYALLPVWGILLLAWLGSYGTISAFQLEDNETALVAYYQGILKCGFVFFMVLLNVTSDLPNEPDVTLWFILILTLFMFPRVSKRAKAMAYASRNNLFEGVGKQVEVIADFMEWDVTKSNEALEVAADPETMNGYRYLVGSKTLWKKKYDRSPPCYRRDFDKETEHIVTAQEIWQCQGELLTSMDSNGKLKDTCLSFALFWMLLRRYTGHPLPEVAAQKGKTWKFVRDGLIPEISEATSKRTFRVIEQEMSFLYDYFYTKNFVTYIFGFQSVIFQFAVMAVYIVNAQILLNHCQTEGRLTISKHIRLDVLITKIVVFAMCVLELALILHYLFITPWSRVGWVCTYVTKQGSKNCKDICQKWVIKKLCGLSLERYFKHWKREVDQYSLLRHHDYVSCKRFLNCCLKIIPIRFYDMSKKGRKSSKSIPFSTDLKMAILSSLHTNGRKLTNGITALCKYKVETEFSWACNLETHTQTIMVWHIATGYSELNYHSQDPANAKKNNSLVLAKHLSEYCAYLVAFKPELLHDQTNTIVTIFNNIIKEANELFEGCKKMKHKYEKMRKMPGEFKGVDDPILKKGICLGKSLADRMSTELLWKMLEEFWAEHLLYLAPSENVSEHIKQLANGGQLLTHLWALLTHAGIITRDE